MSSPVHVFRVREVGREYCEKSQVGAEDTGLG